MTAVGPQLVVDTGDYPIDNANVSGIGLRMVELAQALSARLRVVLFAPQTVDPVFTGRAEVVSGDSNWKALLASRPAVLFADMPHLGRLESAAAAGCTIISENTPPIEQLEYPSITTGPDPKRAHGELVTTYVRQMRLSEHFICRSGVERVGLLATLCALGKLTPTDIAATRTLDHLITLVPLGYSRHSAEVAAEARPRKLADFLWTGGLWSFYQPEMLVDAVAMCRDRGVNTTAAFLYAQPVADNRSIIAELNNRIQQLRLEDQVRLVTDPLRHDTRDQFIKAAVALVAIGRPGVENETCVRLRIRDSRLHGVPIIVDGYGGTAAEVERDKLGQVLPEPDPTRLAEAMMRLADCEKRKATRPLAEYGYERTTTRLISWIEERSIC